MDRREPRPPGDTGKMESSKQKEQNNRYVTFSRSSYRERGGIVSWILWLCLLNEWMWIPYWEQNSGDYSILPGGITLWNQGVTVEVFLPGWTEGTDHRPVATHTWINLRFCFMPFTVWGKTKPKPPCFNQTAMMTASMWISWASFAVTLCLLSFCCFKVKFAAFPCNLEIVDLF